MKRLLAFLLLLLFVLAVPAFAHSGRTDSSGGHNSSTGYHYHHGYPPHNHTDGKCPYNFDDQTGSSSVPRSDNDSKQLDEEADKAAPEKRTMTSALLLVSGLAFLLLLFWIFVPSPLRTSIKKRKNNKHQ